MEKYMGNKSKICKSIFDEVYKNVNKKKFSFFDVFSGTTNVSKYFKNQGCSIICNDVNDMSYVLGKCYIENIQIPTFEVLLKSNTFSRINFDNVCNTNSFKKYSELLMRENKNTTNSTFVNKYKNSNYFRILTYLTYYSSASDYDNNLNDFQYNPIELLNKNYCEYGNNSRYINLVYKKTLDNLLKSNLNVEERKLIEEFYVYPYDEKKLKSALELIINGEYDDKIKKSATKILGKNNITGNRMFFSSSHAKKLDCIINTILFWKRKGILLENEYYILLCSIIETIAIFSNTSATYQAFYKEYKANTIQPFRLIIPELLTSKNSCMAVYQEDAVDLVKRISADVAYFDPPYNWRQYDSNYHLLNTIAKIDDINVSSFEQNIVGASGENRIEKPKYTNLNTTSNFEKIFLEMLKICDCKTIVISYSDSESNHVKGDNKYIVDLITDYFKNNERVFDINTLRIVKLKSKNFESRKGKNKNNINELLIIVNKK